MRRTISDQSLSLSEGDVRRGGSVTLVWNNQYDSANSQSSKFTVGDDL